MRTLTVKNWETFQHYRHRSPPWIKLHREIANDYAFMSLRDKTKAHLIMIWMLAAGNNGTVPYDERFIASRIGATDPIDFDAIIAAGFLIASDDEGVIEQPKAPKPPKHANGTTGFDEFWSLYPRREAKARALKAWKAAAPDEPTRAAIAAAIAQQRSSPQWTREGGKFVPHPASWLNDKRWLDEAQAPAERQFPI